MGNIKKVEEPTPPIIQENQIQSALIEIVKRTDIDPDRLEKFLDVQIKMEERQQEKAFNKALAGFQGDCPIIPKSKKVNFKSNSGNTTQYNYAPLEEIAEVIKPHLDKWELSYRFKVKEIDDKKHELITVISHSLGHSEESGLPFNPIHDDQRMNTSQRRKSALSYIKRTGIENALGLVTADEDDDARSAVDREATESQIKQIYALIEETKSNLPDFLNFLQVESLETMSEQEANRGLNALITKKTRGDK